MASGLRRTIVVVSQEAVVAAKIERMKQHPQSDQMAFESHMVGDGKDGRHSIVVESQIDLTPDILGDLRSRARSAG